MKRSRRSDSFIKRMQKYPAIRYLAESKTRQARLLAFMAVLCSLIIYAWYISIGQWTHWPTNTNYYDQLASSFQHGKLWLEQQPSPALSALPNPYDYAARKNANIPFLWDASLYKGKYFLYWGPAPAVILAGIKFIFPVVIGDQYLVYGFLAGLLIFNALLIIKLWRRFFQDASVFFIPAVVLLAALVCPIPWALNQADIYTAAVAGGQFFLMGGLYFAYSALENERGSKLNLLLAGVCLAGSVWSRITMVIPIAFITFMALWRIVGKNGGENKISRWVPKLVMLGFPLILGAIGLGWYNWVRFGSIFETGIRYQLTYSDFNALNVRTFSPGYILPNVWINLLTPVRMKKIFPFIVPKIGQIPPFLSAFDQPHVEQVTGLAYSLPFGLLAIIPVLTLLSGLFLNKRGMKNNADDLSLWISLVLIGIVFLTFSEILLFFYAVERYLADIVPSLVMLSLIGFWQGYDILRRKPIARNVYILGCAALAILSIAASLLLAITGDSNNFQRLNPHLFNALIQFFQSLNRTR